MKAVECPAAAQHPLLSYSLKQHSITAGLQCLQAHNHARDPWDKSWMWALRWPEPCEDFPCHSTNIRACGGRSHADRSLPAIGRS